MMRDYPDTRKETIIEEIHGIRIEDPYRWLEDSASQEVMDWVDCQNELTRSVIDEYPGYERVRKRLSGLCDYDQVFPFKFEVKMTAAGPRFFYLFRGAGTGQPKLCYQDGETGQRIVLFDPATVLKEQSASVDWFFANNDGSMIAFGVSEGGTEKSVLHVMKVATKELLQERIPETKWCSLKWLNNQGFYYSRYPDPTTVSDEDLNYYHHVYYHRLGDDYRKDVKVFGEGRLKTEHPLIFSNSNCSLLVIASERFTSRDIHVAGVDLMNPTNLEFIPVIETDSFLSVPLLDGNNLYLMTQRDAPNGKIVKYDLTRFHTDGVVPEDVTVVQESDGVIFVFKHTSMGTRFAVHDEKIAVIEERNASSSLKVYDEQSGTLVDDVDFETPVTLYTLDNPPESDVFYYTMSSFFSPLSIYAYENGKNRSVFESNLGIDATQFKSEQVWYTSKDGTKVSMFLFSKRNVKQNKQTPVTIFGYGGYGIPMRPEYEPSAFAWVDLGGILALTNLRGGGEYGQKWHKAGNRGNKQNVFDDFIAAAEWLIEKGIGSTETIAITGRSNGGLLVGAALVQKPDLFAAVTCHVPLLDMIRYTKFHVAKTWMSEYGDPEIKEEFDWIYPYSPYHHIRSVAYPATLLLTALGDTRVDPMHAFKMAARIQSTTKAFDEKRPILLFTESESGHAIGDSTERTIDMMAKSFVFRAHHTGLKINQENLI